MKAGGYGLYGQYAQNGGWSWGGSYTAQLSEDGNRKEDKGTQKEDNIYFSFSIPELGYRHDLASWKDNDAYKNSLQPQSELGKTLGDAKAWAKLHGMETYESRGGFFNLFHDNGDTKLQIMNNGDSFFSYNNYEMIYPESGGCFGSYNYGSNPVSHTFLDAIPYALRGL